MVKHGEKMKISEYLNLVRQTDKLPDGNLLPVAFGLYGEIGGLLTIVKKQYRETDIFNVSQNATLKEELGDVFWYLCSLSCRTDFDLTEILTAHISGKTDLNNGRDSLLCKIGELAGQLLDVSKPHNVNHEKISLFLKYFFGLLDIYNLDLPSILDFNVKKISSRFLPFTEEKLPHFDAEFPEFERLPDCFEIEFVQKGERQALRWNGVFIGDPLSDNIQIEDGYKFHDVFHMSYAAMLHWSPLFRSLAQLKRKSCPSVDENQDGGRAIVVEEGISAAIFNIAKENDFFQSTSMLSFDILKIVQTMTKGFEVEACPLSLWEKTIIEGYKAFREIKKNAGGVIIGDKINRTISYRKE